MAELSHRINEARNHVASRWTSEREEVVWSRIERARRREVWTRVAGAVAVLLLLVVGAVVTHRGSPATAALPNLAPVLPVLALPDGSRVAGLSPDTRFETVETGAAGIALRLSQGSARFEVVPRDHQAFRVYAGEATLSVIGTVFTVAVTKSQVSVSVERGRVALAWPQGDDELAAGERRTIARVVGPAPATSSAAPAPSANPAELGGGGRDSRSWRALAEAGEYARARASVNADGPGAIRDDPGDLLLAADVARLSGHPSEALSPLGRVVRNHAADSRAPLAAFTLGRVLLDQLGRPREAAGEFATARRLAPGGALAEDALAREVEAWSRAGDTTMARQRAEEFVRRYPHGRRAAAVRQHGGLE